MSIMYVKSYRVTPAQALCRGALAGGLAGLVIVLLAVPVAIVTMPAALWLVVMTPLILGPLAGAMFGLARGHRVGADVDEGGIQPLPATRDSHAAWPRIEDLRSERYGGRIQVAVYLKTGDVVRLAAPYDGRLLAHDPSFERKLFLLRHLWETHRFTVTAGERDGAG